MAGLDDLLTNNKAAESQQPEQKKEEESSYGWLIILGVVILLVVLVAAAFMLYRRSKGCGDASPEPEAGSCDKPKPAQAADCDAKNCQSVFESSWMPDGVSRTRAAGVTTQT